MPLGMLKIILMNGQINTSNFKANSAAYRKVGTKSTNTRKTGTSNNPEVTYSTLNTDKSSTEFVSDNPQQRHISKSPNITSKSHSQHRQSDTPKDSSRNSAKLTLHSNNSADDIISLINENEFNDSIRKIINKLQSELNQFKDLKVSERSISKETQIFKEANQQAEASTRTLLKKFNLDTKGVEKLLKAYKKHLDLPEDLATITDSPKTSAEFKLNHNKDLYKLLARVLYAASFPEIKSNINLDNEPLEISSLKDLKDKSSETSEVYVPTELEGKFKTDKYNADSKNLVRFLRKQDQIENLAGKMILNNFQKLNLAELTLN
jgi:hypothetical protein